MATFRNPNQDKFKSAGVLKEQIRLDCRCKLIDCDQPLTVLDGPGSDSYCREHQLLLAEYGEGLGRADRPHTFYRNWTCQGCGYDPREDEKRFGDIEDPFERLRAMRGVMHGDHQIRKSDGGTDAADNIRTLCVLCHMAKTYKEKDYRRGSGQ